MDTLLTRLVALVIDIYSLILSLGPEAGDEAGIDKAIECRVRFMLPQYVRLRTYTWAIITFQLNSACIRVRQDPSLFEKGVAQQD